MLKRIVSGLMLAAVVATGTATLGASPAAAASAANATHAASGTNAANANSATNIVERVIQINDFSGAFDTLIAAAVCTPGIADALATTPNITLFAPTDHAFKKLGLTPRNVCSALDDATRADILTYHVYAGVVTYKQASRLSPTKITMLNGDAAKLRGGRFSLRIDGARIGMYDVRASNGIIHAINSVMLP